MLEKITLSNIKLKYEKRCSRHCAGVATINVYIIIAYPCVRHTTGHLGCRKERDIGNTIFLSLGNKPRYSILKHCLCQKGPEDVRTCFRKTATDRRVK